MAHVCGFCSACLDKLPASGVEARGRLGVGQCCNCQQTADLYGVLSSDPTLSTTGAAIRSDKKYAPKGTAKRS